MATKRWVVERFMDQAKFKIPAERDEGRVFDSESQCWAFMLDRSRLQIELANKELTRAHARYRKCQKKSGGK